MWFPFFYDYQDLATILLRLCIAAIFLYHCQSKFGSKDNFMRFIGYAELAGGVAIGIGLLTQLAALGLGIIMAGAIYKKTQQWHVPFSAMDKTGWEFDLMILAACFMILCTGPGEWSVDAVMFNKY